MTEAQAKQVSKITRGRARVGAWAAPLIGAATLAAGHASAATISYTLSGALPSFGTSVDQPAAFTPFQATENGQTLAPSFNIGLGALTGVTIKESLSVGANAQWMPIFRPGTLVVDVPPSVNIGGLVNSTLGGPLNVDLATVGASASAGQIYALSDVGGGSVTTTTTFSDAASLAAFLSTSSPLYLMRTLTVQGGFDSLVSATAAFYGDYETIITYTYAAAGAVPEPMTWVLMIGGLGLAGAQLRRRRMATA